MAAVDGAESPQKRCNGTAPQNDKSLPRQKATIAAETDKAEKRNIRDEDEITRNATSAAHSAYIFVDRNSLINCAVLLPSVYAAVSYHWSFGLAYPAFLLLADVLYYLRGVVVFDPELSIVRGYTLSAVFNDTLHSAGVDYGFNFYDGNYGKSRRAAQVDKFEYAFDKLGLREGMRLIDVGCGCGDWLHWLQTERGVRVRGVNITYTQVVECRRRGLDVICSNWKDLDLDAEGLAGQFDAVTFWDTVEHYVNMKDRCNFLAQDAVYRRMFDMAHKLMKPDTTAGRIFISCLHMRVGLLDLPMGRDKLYKMYYCYVLDKFHSGFYPSYMGRRKDQLVDCAKKNFHVVHRKDTTMDYYMTSVLEPTHFGVHSFRWTPYRAAYTLANVFLDPNWFHRILWYYTSNWMLQFDPSDIDNSVVILWWLVFERN